MKHCPHCGRWAGVCSGEVCKCKACGMDYLKHPRSISQVSRSRARNKLYPTENARTLTELLC